MVSFVSLLDRIFLRSLTIARTYRLQGFLFFTIDVIQVLQASVDPESESEFRLLVNNKFVKYISIDGGLYDSDDMCFGPSLISLLPPLPPGDWNEGHISRNLTTGNVHFAAVSKTRLPGITNPWHPFQIDHLELCMGRKLRFNVYEATCSRFDSTIIAKFAWFP